MFVVEICIHREHGFSHQVFNLDMCECCTPLKLWLFGSFWKLNMLIGVFWGKIQQCTALYITHSISLHLSMIGPAHCISHTVYYYTLAW